jgi:hypothetical protein
MYSSSSDVTTTSCRNPQSSPLITVPCRSFLCVSPDIFKPRDESGISSNLGLTVGLYSKRATHDRDGKTDDSDTSVKIPCGWSEFR